MNNSKVTRLFSAERRMLELRGDITPAKSQPTTGDGPTTDLSVLLSAIYELKEMIVPSAPQPEAHPDLPELSKLRDQLKDLRDHIHETKIEIASIRHPDQDEDRLTTAATELDAIVAETENATHRILNATEDIGDLLDKLKVRTDDVGAQTIMEEAMGKTIEIMEACNFQDLSGQRTTKVIKTINYLEEHIMSMIEIWGEEGFKEVEIEKEVLDDDDQLLHGPQHEGQGINQADIDALFD